MSWVTKVLRGMLSLSVIGFAMLACGSVDEPEAELPDETIGDEVIGEAEQALTVTIPNGGFVTCAYDNCHSNCQANSSCPPTNTGQPFKVFKNTSGSSKTCTLNGYINGYPQCRSSKLSWMTYKSWTTYCGCG